MKKQIKKTIAGVLALSGAFCFGAYQSEPSLTVTAYSEDFAVAISDGMDDEHKPSDYPNKPYYSLRLCVEEPPAEKKCVVIKTVSSDYPLWPWDLGLPPRIERQEGVQVALSAEEEELAREIQQVIADRLNEEGLDRALEELSGITAIPSTD